MSLKKGRTLLAMCILFLFSFVFFPKQAKAVDLQAYSDGKVYDVTKYGADKTGAKSSESAVQKAIEEAKRDIRRGNLEGKTGTVLYFPKGKYRISTAIRPALGMAIVADGATITAEKDSAIRIYSGTGYVIEGGTWTTKIDDTVIAVSRIPDVTIKNLNVKSGKTGIGFFTSNGTLSNVKVTKSKGLGIQLSTKSEVTLKKCEIYHNGYSYPKKGYLGHGIGVYSNSVLKISDSEINDNRECGISLQEGSATVKKCSLNDNGRHAVGTRKVCSITMSSCKMLRNGLKDDFDAVIVVEGSKGRFTNCKFYSSGMTGLLVTGARTDVSVKKCTFKGNEAHNIYGDHTGSGKFKIVIDSCTFYKCKSSDSVTIHVNNKSNYSVTVKGTNKYYVKPHYTYHIGSKMIYKN